MIKQYVTADEAQAIREIAAGTRTTDVESPRLFLPVEIVPASNKRPSCRLCGCIIDPGEEVIAFGFDAAATAEGGPASWSRHQARAYVHIECKETP